MKNPKRPYSGWIVRLEQFNYKIQYRPGSKHVNADFNSRIQPTEEENCKRSVASQTDLQVMDASHKVTAEKPESLSLSAAKAECVHKCASVQQQGIVRDTATELSEVKGDVPLYQRSWMC